MINPNADPNVESGGGPFARGRAPASAMGVWRTPKNEEYATPEALVGRKVRVYFDGDCTYFEAQVCVHTCGSTSLLVSVGVMLSLFLWVRGWDPSFVRSSTISSSSSD